MSERSEIMATERPPGSRAAMGRDQAAGAAPRGHELAHRRTPASGSSTHDPPQPGSCAELALEAPELVHAVPPRTARGNGRALPVGPRRLRLGQQLLLRGRAGGHEELEGVLLRLLRRGELHHRRQAAGVAVGDGAVGPDLRRQRVEHPRAAGARGRGRRRPALRDGTPLVRRRGAACSPGPCSR